MRALVAALLLVACAASAHAQQQLDQEQLVYDSGTSARTLPGYSHWQSFTCGITGTLTQVDVGFFNDMSGDATLEIIEGSTPAGTVLQTLNVPIVGFSVPGVSWNEWTVSVPVVAGVMYVMHWTPNAATLPDPYGVCGAFGGPYLGGTMGLIDPSGTYDMPFDCVFRTWVTTGAVPAISVYRDTSPVDVDDVANIIATVTASPFDDLAPPAAPLLCYEVDDGAGNPDLIFVEKMPGGGVRIRW